MAVLASAEDKFQPSSSRLLLLLDWPPLQGHIYNSSVSAAVGTFQVRGRPRNRGARLARGSVSKCRPQTAPGPAFKSRVGHFHNLDHTECLNSTGSGTQIPSHRTNLFTLTPPQNPYTPVWPRQCWTIFQTVAHRNLRGQHDKFRRRSEISQKWDHSSSSLLLPCGLPFPPRQR